MSARKIDFVQNLPVWSIEMSQNLGYQILSLGWIEYNCAKVLRFVRGLNTDLVISWAMKALYLSKPHLVFQVVRYQEAVLHFDIGVHRK